MRIGKLKYLQDTFSRTKRIKLGKLKPINFIKKMFSKYGIGVYPLEKEKIFLTRNKNIFYLIKGDAKIKMECELL